MNKRSSNYAIPSLIFVNCIPIIGVLFFDWTISSILLLYWLENIVIGFYAILRIATSARDYKRKTTFRGYKYLFRLFIILFFIVHYGIFTFVHGIFVLSAFRSFEHIRPISSLDLIYINLILLFISHGISYFTNYIRKGE